uniref:Uncharacterized protein n=1 Tax=Romanomermis culicivorax TaxID=13658 RepID=A0A915IBG9_ROMCU
MKCPEKFILRDYILVAELYTIAMNKIISTIFLWSSMWNLTINHQAASQNIAQFFKDRMSMVTCESGEVCHIDLLSLAMCACPGQKPCSKDFTKEIRGVEY